MNNQNLKSFRFVLAITTALLVIVLGMMMLLRDSNPIGIWGPGMWWSMGGIGSCLIFPLFGLTMMLVMMSFFINSVGSRGGFMGCMFGDRSSDRVSPSVGQGHVRFYTSCGLGIESSWNVCPHCGTALLARHSNQQTS